LISTHDFFYYGYVNDIVMIVSSSEIEFVFDRFNSFHLKLQFTIEISNKTINFFDATIIIKNKILFD